MEDNLKNIKAPVEFSGDAQLLLYTRYGDPRDIGWDHKWITEWHVHQHFSWFPEPHIRIHKHMAPLLERAFRELEAAGLHKEIRTLDCAHEVRLIKGSEAVLSVHSWGAAIDLNAKQNPYGSAGEWSSQFIEIMSKSSLFCGQQWPIRKDPMHFSMVNG